MSSMKQFVQAGFMVGLLGAGATFAATPAPDKAAPAAPATAPAAQPAGIDASGPSQLIESSAKVLLTGIEQRRAEFRKDPTGLYTLVEQTLLPNFDTPYAAQQVLGLNWRNATPDQRKRFVDAFYKSLLYTYGDAMIDFTGDRLKVYPTKVGPEDTRATVRTEIKRSNGTKVAVNYTLRKTNGQWKAWDVVIDGISYVKSYREDYGAEVQQKGLDAVIQRLEDRAANARAAKGQVAAPGKTPSKT
jgi:phospholipid transport system substrate-binding protein